MGHTNSTTYYNLPQFLTSDKPAWLTDINNAFSDIDAAVHNAQSDANTAGTNASQALLDASAAATAASTADAKGAGACASIEAAFDATSVYAIGTKVMYNSLLYRCTVAVTTPGPWTGSANWERITVDSIIPGNAGDLPLGSTTPAGSTAEMIANIGSNSSSEKIIGTWTDGSTLYKKTIKSTSITSDALNNIAHGISGLNQLVDISGSCTRADSVLMPVPRITSDGANGLISVSSVNATYVVLYVGFNYTGPSAITEAVLTLIYTKV